MVYIFIVQDSGNKFLRHKFLETGSEINANETARSKKKSQEPVG